MEERVEIHVQVQPGRHRKIDNRTWSRRVVDAVARWLRLSEGSAAVVTGLLMYGAGALALALITALPLA